jgi:hypothetical protein
LLLRLSGTQIPALHNLRSRLSLQGLSSIAPVFTPAYLLGLTADEAPFGLSVPLWIVVEEARAVSFERGASRISVWTAT